MTPVGAEALEWDWQQKGRLFGRLIGTAGKPAGGSRRTIGSPEIRLAARKEHSLPMVAVFKSWFEKQLSMISSGSTLAADIRYTLNHWQGLTRFLEDGRLELDTNPVENAIRPVCLDQENALFAGHEIGAEN